MITGNLYEIDSSTSQQVELSIKEKQYFIKANETILFSGDISKIEISSRIANIQRKLILENSMIFTTNENDLVDLYLLKPLNKKSLIHKLESHLALILISLVITILIGFSFFKWGIPYSSKKLAFLLPSNITSHISKTTFETLDKYVLTKSKLKEEDKQKTLDSYKKSVLPYLNKEEYSNIKINFREWKIDKQSIPNAFALPDGNIVLTDEFVRLSKNSDEVNSVLFHEIGHVVHRHSLQRVIEGTFISVFIMYISGDGTMFSDLGVGLSSMFIDSHYSRSHELEADNYAFKKMLKANINPKSFSNILNRISKSKSDDDSIFDYFSSHPSNKKRIDIANKYLECYNKKLTICK